MILIGQMGTPIWLSLGYGCDDDHTIPPQKGSNSSFCTARCLFRYHHRFLSYDLGLCTPLFQYHDNDSCYGKCGFSVYWCSLFWSLVLQDQGEKISWCVTEYRKSNSFTQNYVSNLPCKSPGSQLFVSNALC